MERMEFPEEVITEEVVITSVISILSKNFFFRGICIKKRSPSRRGGRGRHAGH